MKKIRTHIIPEKQESVTINAPKELHIKAICCFMATGFFLEDDTYYKRKKVLRPATEYTLDENSRIVSSNTYFKWHYSPRALTFKQALDEFEQLFDTIMQEQTAGKKVILPLSGGIDSRTQAVALAKHPKVHSYSYKFKNGYPEDAIGRKIAKALGFECTSLEVPEGYLWNSIEELAAINECYTDFTLPRQMAFVNAYGKMGDVFSLGHWGDVLFDGLGEVQWDEAQQLDWVLKKVVKKGGLEIADSLWKSWNIEGDFKSYFTTRIKTMLKAIDIDNTSAKLRAFKSIYWAPRWTSVNLGVFESVAPITLPYYDNRMCEFICTIPEEFLKDRQLQIAYIQRKSKKVAKITWHEQKPFNLNTYQWNKKPYNLPYRILSKLQREYKSLAGKPHVSRNWELQYLGKENDRYLKEWLFESGLEELISKEVIQQYYDNFTTANTALPASQVWYSHPVGMLLTLAVFRKKII